MTNLSYLFHVKYYDALHYSPQKTNFKSINKQLFDQSFIPIDSAKTEDHLSTFPLRVAQYPGLLVGIGNPHDAGDVTNDNDEITLGFSLDYVTGLPYIPGSTVKGVLRSVFKHHKDYVFEDVLSQELRALVGSAGNLWKKLGVPLFGDEKNAGSAVFFDAFPVETGNKQGRLLGPENITPHVNHKHPELTGLTEPKPLSLLKVLGGTVFCFKVDLSDAMMKIKESVKVEVEDILETFKIILCTIGIGAKTNVGFGGMERCDCMRTVAVKYKGEEVGICRHPGCKAVPQKKKDGSYHMYCTPHFLENQGKGKSENRDEQIGR